MMVIQAIHKLAPTIPNAGDASVRRAPTDLDASLTMNPPPLTAFPKYKKNGLAGNDPY